MHIRRRNLRARGVVIAARGQYKKFDHHVEQVEQPNSREDVIAMLTRLIRKGEEIRGKTAANANIGAELSTAVDYAVSDAAADRSA